MIIIKLNHARQTIRPSNANSILSNSGVWFEKRIATLFTFSRVYLRERER